MQKTRARRPCYELLPAHLDVERTLAVHGDQQLLHVVSGTISGQSETLPLYVRRQFELLNGGAGYSAALLLAIVALLTVVSMNVINRKREI